MRIRTIVLSALGIMGVSAVVFAAGLPVHGMVDGLHNASEDGIIGFVVFLLILCCAFISSMISGPSDVVHFKAPVAVVAHLSSADEKFKGSDIADFLGDFYAVSHKEVNGVRSFTFTQKGAGSIDISCTLDGKCAAKKAAELKAV